jgi:hypothetical protein
MSIWGLEKAREEGILNSRGSLQKESQNFVLWTTDVNLFNYVINVTWDQFSIIKYRYYQMCICYICPGKFKIAFFLAFHKNVMLLIVFYFIVKHEFFKLQKLYTCYIAIQIRKKKREKRINK